VDQLVVVHIPLLKEAVAVTSAMRKPKGSPYSVTEASAPQSGAFPTDFESTGASKEKTALAEPTALSTVTWSTWKEASPFVTHASTVFVAQLAVEHMAFPNPADALKFGGAKLTPYKVKLAAPVKGTLSRTSEATGASNENKLLLAVPTILATDTHGFFGEPQLQMRLLMACCRICKLVLEVQDAVSALILLMATHGVGSFTPNCSPETENKAPPQRGPFLSKPDSTGASKVRTPCMPVPTG
jgi:hypothetical protein